MQEEQRITAKRKRETECVEAMELTVNVCASPDLLAAANHVYTAHYSKPFPKPADDAPLVYWEDWSPVPNPPRPGIDSVQRPNHGLANALRKALLVPSVADAFRAKQEDLYSFSAAMLHTMQVAMLFEVCCRESDIGFNDDPDVFMRYHTASCAAFRAWATSSDSISEEHATICFDALERMYMEPKTPASAPVLAIFEACHDLDLYRCYDDEKMQRKLNELKQLVGEDAGERLAILAVRMIKKTGGPYPSLSLTRTGTYTLTLTRRS